MNLIQNVSGKVDLFKQGGAKLQMPLLNAVVRERAAYAMNEPRFREISTGRNASPSMAPIVDSLHARIVRRLQFILVALCALCAGALITFVYLGGHRDAGLNTTELKPIEQLSFSRNASRDAEVMSPTQGVVPEIDVRTEAAELVEKWAAAWSKRDVDRYLKFYSKSFVPPDNNSLEAWEQTRRNRILGKRHISVTIRDLNVELLDDNRAIAQFAQTYAADNYRESPATKVLILAREGNAWRIAAEMNSRDAASQVSR